MVVGAYNLKLESSGVDSLVTVEPKSQYIDMNGTGGYDKTLNWKSVRALEGFILTYFITESLKICFQLEKHQKYLIVMLFPFL